MLNYLWDSFPLMQLKKLSIPSCKTCFYLVGRTHWQECNHVCTKNIIWDTTFLSTLFAVIVYKNGNQHCCMDIYCRQEWEGRYRGWAASHWGVLGVVGWCWTGIAGVKIPYALVSSHHRLRLSHGDYSTRQIQSKSFSSCSGKRTAVLKYIFTVETMRQSSAGINSISSLICGNTGCGTPDKRETESIKPNWGYLPKCNAPQWNEATQQCGNIVVQLWLRITNLPTEPAT